MHFVHADTDTSIHVLAYYVRMCLTPSDGRFRSAPAFFHLHRKKVLMPRRRRGRGGGGERIRGGTDAGFKIEIQRG